MWLKRVNIVENHHILEKYALLPTTLCSFWKNLSGHFVRFVCNHSYGYAHNDILGRTEQTSSLRFPQNSAFL
jgi:hypothetical protein